MVCNFYYQQNILLSILVLINKASLSDFIIKNFYLELYHYQKYTCLNFSSYYTKILKLFI